MTKTTNYQLNQWAKSDRVMMDDFNACRPTASAPRRPARLCPYSVFRLLFLFSFPVSSRVH